MGMSSDLTPYNIAAIRNLLQDAFTADTLWRFCQDRADFQPVLLEIGRSAGLAEMAEKLLERCRTQLLFDKLVAAIREINPRQYERYQSQLYTGEADFPPTSHIPHNLPRRSEFVGRETEKARIHQALGTRAYLISIEGIGGIGKSALALEVAYECFEASKGNTPPDGIATFAGFVWTTVKERAPTLDDLLDTVAIALDYRGLAERSLGYKRTGVEKILRERSILLIVDNLDTKTGDEVCDFLHYLPEPSKALITSREHKVGNAWLIPLGGLEASESLELVRSEGRRLNLGSIDKADDRTLLPLHHATGGVPLALKWAVGQIKQRGQALDTVLAAIHDGRGDVFERIFYHSWALLSADAAQVLTAMSVFATDASYAGIEAASDVHYFALDDALGQLVTMSLLDATNELELASRRYSIHPLTRVYVSAMARKDKQREELARAAFERIVSYYHRLTIAPEPAEPDMWYWSSLLNYTKADDLEPEWDNIAYSIQRLLKEGQDEKALKLFLGIVHFMHGWGLWNERLRMGHEICAVARRQADSCEAWLWIDTIGFTLIQQQRFEEAVRALVKGRAVAERFGMDNALLSADAFEAWIYAASSAHDLDRARRIVASVRERIDIDSLPTCPDKVRQIVATRVVGLIAVLNEADGEWEEARRFRRLELELRYADGENPAPVLLRVADLSIKLGDIATAKECMDRAVATSRHKDLAKGDFLRALVAEQEGQYRQARRLCLAALEKSTRLGYERGKRRCEELLTRLLAMGDVEG